MESVRLHISTRQARLGEHSFFRGLERRRSAADVVALAPAFAFWCRALRDVLEACAARRCSADGADHEDGYFADVERLMANRLPTCLVAGDAHPLAREASYQLLYEVLASDTEYMRLVLLGALQATRELFFRRVAPLAASLSDDERQLAFEQYMDAVPAELDALALAPEDEPEAIALVDRVFNAFDRMFDGFCAMVA